MAEPVEGIVVVVVEAIVVGMVVVDVVITFPLPMTYDPETLPDNPELLLTTLYVN